jgi:hypothetical protein
MASRTRRASDNASSEFSIFSLYDCNLVAAEAGDNIAAPERLFNL